MTRDNWILLIVGLVGGAVLNVLANLGHPLILKVIGWNNERALTKKKESEWRSYLHVKSLYDRRIDKYSYYLIFCTVSVLFFVAASTAGLVLILFRDADIGAWRDALVISGAFCFASAIAIMSTIITIEVRLHSFLRYQAKVERKFGLPPADFK